MVLLVEAEELASHMQRGEDDPLDRASAEQAIATSSSFVESKTGLAFTPRTATVRLPSSAGLLLQIPLRPLTAVVSAKIGGTAYTDFVLTADGAIHRTRSWRTTVAPQIVEVTVQFGCARAPDDIKGVVYEMAEGIYDGRLGVESETIDDYRVAYSGVLSATSVQTLANYGADVAALSMAGR